MFQESSKSDLSTCIYGRFLQPTIYTSARFFITAHTFLNIYHLESMIT